MRSPMKAVIAVSALLLSLALGVTIATATAPVVNIDSSISSSYTSAHLTGEVDPEDQDTYWYFQYAIDPDAEGWSSGPEAFAHTLAANGPAVQVSEDLTGLKPGTEYEVRLVAAPTSGAEAETVSAAPNPTFTTLAVLPPSAHIEPVTTVTGTTAQLTGSINPNAPEAVPTSAAVEAGFKIDWHFECTPECPGLEGGTVAAGNVGVDVSAEATGLEPNTIYEIRLVATNAGSTTSDGPASFETDPVAPWTQTLYAGSVDAESAVLAANVNPKNSPVIYQFEWGVGQDYASTAPVSPQLVGAEDDASHLVTAPINGLSPGTPYHFRVVAINTDTSTESHGEDHVVTTLELSESPGPCPNEHTRIGVSVRLPECRAYEMVSPLDKNGSDVLMQASTGRFTSRAAASGTSVAFASFGAFGDSPANALGAHYLSSRSSNGWSTKGVGKPVDAFAGGDVSNAMSTLYFSPDLSFSVFHGHDTQDPQAQRGVRSLYLERFPSADINLLEVPADPLPPADDALGIPGFDAATPDGSTVLFSSTKELTPGGSGLYQWHDGVVTSIGPFGLPPGFVSPGARDPQVNIKDPGQHLLSDDGNRVFFSANTGGSSAGALYVREAAGSVHLISASERAGDDPTVPVLMGKEKQGQEEIWEGFQFAKSSNGAQAFFAAGTKLTDDATAVSLRPDLYRWTDAADGNGLHLTDLTTQDPNGAGFGSILAGDADATHLYFVAYGDLAPGAGDGPDLYLWHPDSTSDGHLAHIATLSDSDSALWSQERGRSESGSHQFAVSEGGGLLLFSSDNQLTSYETSGTRQAYLYDADADSGSGSLVCISCSDRNPASTADATLSYFSKSQPWRARNLSADGTVAYFDTVQRLLSSDTNERFDVYRWSAGQGLALISAGQSARDSRFLDASLSGDDAFFTTAQQLVGTDIDNLVDVYDARVGGGFSQPLASPACDGDACQPPPVVPNDVTPASAGTVGPDSSTQHVRRRCSKHKTRGRRNGRPECKRHKRVHTNRRPGR